MVVIYCADWHMSTHTHKQTHSHTQTNTPSLHSNTPTQPLHHQGSASRWLSAQSENRCTAEWNRNYWVWSCSIMVSYEHSTTGSFSIVGLLGRQCAHEVPLSARRNFRWDCGCVHGASWRSLSGGFTREPVTPPGGEPTTTDTCPFFAFLRGSCSLLSSQFIMCLLTWYFCVET